MPAINWDGDSTIDINTNTLTKRIHFEPEDSDAFYIHAGTSAEVLTDEQLQWAASEAALIAEDWLTHLPEWAVEGVREACTATEFSYGKARHTLSCVRCVYMICLKYEADLETAERKVSPRGLSRAQRAQKAVKAEADRQLREELKGTKH